MTFQANISAVFLEILNYFFQGYLSFLLQGELRTYTN